MYGHLFNTKINLSECVFKCFQFVSRESLTIKRCLPFEVRVTVGSPNSPRNPCSIDHPEKLFFLREPQHIPGAYPQASPNPQRHSSIKLLVGGLGCVPGICWNILTRCAPTKIINGVITPISPITKWFYTCTNSSYNPIYKSYKTPFITILGGPTLCRFRMFRPTFSGESPSRPASRHVLRALGIARHLHDDHLRPLHPVGG